ncbi:aldo/keto reductase [Verrucomicrobia bacterium]|nr:aldo/keto reductase [Verrucomicrobiota bacterium]MDG1892003.1 aldo/keto reductase [Verrucomicrobiota bacterium]
MRLGLGTVQFGGGYGIANRTGQVDHSEALQILKQARQNGVDTIDTAITYGDSETRLGCLGVEDFKLITKLPPLPRKITSVENWVKKQVKDSIARLKVNTLHGLLLHRAGDLVGENGVSIFRSIESLKDSGCIQKFGVSIYNPQELDALPGISRIDLVQAPLNLIDRRLLMDGWLNRLKANDIEVHVRSVFLQGLLLMPRKRIPSQFERWASLWDAWEHYLVNTKTSAVAACLSYPLSIDKVDKVIVGVDSSAQWECIVKQAQSSMKVNEWPSMASCDEALLNPSKWITS